MASSAHFSWSDHPPQTVVLFTTFIDLLCYPLTSNWRAYVPSDWSWIQREYNASSCLGYPPPILTYADYVANNSLDFFSFSSIYSYAFETDSTALGLLTSPTSMIVLFFLVMALRSIKAILLPYFSSIGRSAGRKTHGVEWEQHNEIRILKFGEYVFRLIYHSCISIYGVVAFRDKVWWDPERGGTANLYMGFPFHPIEPGMAWYYLIQCAYNLEALISLVELSFTFSFCMPSTQSYFLPVTIAWKPTVRGDFREMCIHHVVTNILVIGSSFLRFTRIGSMVFMVHDLSDIPVDFSKLANFLKWKAATAMCFLTMVLCWLYFRLGILPFTIVRSVLTQSQHVLDPPSDVPHDCYVVYQGLFKVLLMLIVLLHTLWFWMFIQMGYYLVFKGETHDLSEHKKGEDQKAVPNGREKED